MTKSQITNIPASIHQRLLNLDPSRTYDFTPVLRRYAFERWLYRLGQSVYSAKFIVKGAMLFVFWTSDIPRKTMDLDLLGVGNLTENQIRRSFVNIGCLKCEADGLHFDMKSMALEPIRNEADFQGIRANFSGHLGNIRIPLQVDIGIGDRIWPAPETIIFPTLLGLPAPRVRAYRKETSIAEKFDAMLKLGAVNSRMKDFYDIRVLASRFSFKGAILKKTLETVATQTPRISLSMPPIALTNEFGRDRNKNIQWEAFLRRIGKNPSDLSFPQTIASIRSFLLPVLEAIVKKTAFDKIWPPGGPWRPREKKR